MIEIRNVSSSQALRYSLRLVKETLPARWLMFGVGVLCMVGVAYFSGALANSTKAIVDDVFVSAAPDAAMMVGLTVIGIAAAKSLFSFATSIISFVFDRSITVESQKRLFDHVLSQDTNFFVGQHASRQMTLLQNIGRASGRSVALLTNKLIVETLTLISLFYVMIVQDPLMTLICVTIIPLIFALVSNLAKRIRRASKAELKLAGQYFERGSEILQGIKTVKSFQLEQKSINRFNATLNEMEKRVLHVARISAATVPAMELLGGIVIGLFVLYGAQQATSGAMTPGELTAFITAFLMAYQPAERLSKLWVDLQKNGVFVAQMYAILDRPPARTRYGQAELPHDTTPKITTHDLSFAYSDDTPALHEVTLTIQPGERIAVVGPSGAGKSTLIDMLLRFQDADQGHVAFDGVDIRTLKHEALHHAIAYVSQDIFLFDGTIGDNIADGDPNLSRDELIQAARSAQLEDLLTTSQDGIDSAIGPNGNALSGGQRQRLGIARGLAKKARIYIFDEATSALDPYNEGKVLETLQEVLAGSTQIFVTHRTSIFAYVDRVLVLSDGRVAGFDRPDILMRNNEVFRTLFADTEPGLTAQEALDD